MASINKSDGRTPGNCFNCESEADAAWHPESGDAPPFCVCRNCAIRIFVALLMDAYQIETASKLAEVLDKVSKRAATVVARKIAAQIKGGR